MKPLAIAALALVALACSPCEDAEIPYDGVDNDCLLSTPDDDLDGDGYGIANDCDDRAPNVHPDAVEVCNDRDDNCDGVVDGPGEGVAYDNYYADADGDGWGDPDTETRSCAPIAGMITTADDCDDTDADFHPTAIESHCDDPNDYNCDGEVGYADVDDDGWAACNDCNDADATIYIGAPELCDDEDNDCDGIVPDDELDADDDGFSTCEGDCDDANLEIYPGAGGCS